MGRPGISHHHATTGGRNDFGLEPALSALPNKTPDRDAKKEESGTGEKCHRNLFLNRFDSFRTLRQKSEQVCFYFRMWNDTLDEATCIDGMGNKPNEICTYRDRAICLGSGLPFDKEHRRLRAAGDMQLMKYIGKIILHGLVAQIECRGDLLVRLSFGDERQHPFFLR